MFKNPASSLMILILSFILTGCNGSSSSPSPKDTTAPVLSAEPRGGTYNHALNVTLSADESAKIYYTLDESAPDKNSEPYVEPIRITVDTTLRAIAIDAAGNKIEELNEKYIFDTQPPIVTATVDQATGLITLSADEPATIYYMLDATDSGITDATLYTKPFPLGKETTVYYFAQDIASNSSGVENKTYNVKLVLAQNYVSSNNIDDTRSILLDNANNLWFASNSAKGVSKYNTEDETWHTYTTANGLPDYFFKAIFKESSGNLWFVHRGGVSKYDITEDTWTSYRDGLIDNDVKAITQDKDGNMWFGTVKGASKYIVKEDKWEAYTKDNTKDGESIGLINDNVNAIFKDKADNLWFGTNGGVSKYDTSARWTSYTSDNTTGSLLGSGVGAIAQDNDGNMWFGALIGGVNKYIVSENKWMTYTTANGLVNNGDEIFFVVNNVFVDSDNNLWVMTNGGISRHDIKNDTWVPYSLSDGLSSNVIYAAAEDADGNIWFGNESVFVDKFDGEKWSAYNTAKSDNELQSNIITSSFKDSDGNLWFGTEGGGVSKYDGNTLTTTIKGDLVDNHVQGITQDKDGNMWFGTWAGVSKYNINTDIWETYTKENTKTETTSGLINNNVRTIVQDKNDNIWFGTDEAGVSKYDTSGKWTTYTQQSTDNGLVDNHISVIFKDKDDNLWFGTDGGVSKYNIENSTWEETYTEQNTTNDLINNDVQTIGQDKDSNMYFGTNWGVSKYDGIAWTTYTQQNTTSGLLSDAVNVIFKDKDDNLWFGTSNGVSKYDGSLWISYTKTDGLLSNSVQAITQDKNGNLWFGTNKGGISNFIYLPQEN